MRCPRILHGWLRFAARKSADYLCGSSAEKRKLLVTSTVYEQYPAQQNLRVIVFPSKFVVEHQQTAESLFWKWVGIVGCLCKQVPLLARMRGHEFL